jgi:hypothetical protein
MPSGPVCPAVAIIAPTCDLANVHGLGTGQLRQPVPTASVTSPQAEPSELGRQVAGAFPVRLSKRPSPRGNALLRRDVDSYGPLAGWRQAPPHGGLRLLARRWLACTRSRASPARSAKRRPPRTCSPNGRQRTSANDLRAAGQGQSAGRSRLIARSAISVICWSESRVGSASSVGTSWRPGRTPTPTRNCSPQGDGAAMDHD